jgi:hypothetical protein
MSSAALLSSYSTQQWWIVTVQAIIRSGHQVSLSFGGGCIRHEPSGCVQHWAWEAQTHFWRPCAGYVFSEYSCSICFFMSIALQKSQLNCISSRRTTKFCPTSSWSAWSSVALLTYFMQLSRNTYLPPSSAWPIGRNYNGSTYLTTLFRFCSGFRFRSRSRSPAIIQLPSIILLLHQSVVPV